MRSESLYIKRDVSGAEVSFPLNGVPARIGEYSYSAQRMGGTPQLAATLKYPTCLDTEWTGKEYVEFNGERYYILNTPTSKKDNSELPYTHEITFVSERVMLEREFFYDVLIYRDSSEYPQYDIYKDRYRSNLSEFSFMGTIEEFVYRFNDALEHVGFYDSETGEGYHVVIDSGIATDKIVEVSFSNEYLASALQRINTDFKLPYYWVGKTCHVGYTENVIEGVFEYGKGSGLVSVEKANSNAAVINRITGSGGTENIPYYYPNQSADGTALYTTDNFGSGEVKKIDLSLLGKYVGNPLSCTLALCRGQMSGSNLVSVSDTIVDGSEEYEFAGQPVDSSNRDEWYNGEDMLRVCYKIYGLKSRVLHFSPYSTGLQWQGNVTVNSKGMKVHVKPWDGDITNRGAQPVEGTREYVFAEDGWYMFVVQHEFSYSSNSGGFRIECSVTNNKVKYDPQIPEGTYFSDGNGAVIPVSSGAIELSDIGDIPYKDASLTFSIIDGGGKWVESCNSASGGTISITGRDFIPYCKNLMPTIYRTSAGKERYYNARNNTYRIPGTDDCYEFDNVYSRENPHAAIQSFPDISPTIAGIENSHGELIAEVEDVAFDNNDNNNADDSGAYEHSYFYMKLRVFDGDFGFNIFQHGLESEPMKISMTSGACASCSFEIAVVKKTSDDGKSFYFLNPVQVDSNGDIVAGDFEDKVKEDNIIARQQDTSKNSVWIALKKETETRGEVMPNRSQGIYPNSYSGQKDSFVITGIKLPQVYIDAAEKRLDEALIAHMKDNNVEKFNFSIKFSRIWLEYNKSRANLINENARLTVRYNNINTLLYVTNFSLKADGNVLNEVAVELAEDVAVAQSTLALTLKEVKEDIVNSISTPNADVLGIGSQHFLRKDRSDSTSHDLGAKNLAAKEKVTARELLTEAFSQGLLGGAGGGVWLDEHGKSHGEVDYLSVRMKAVFAALEINKTLYTAGDQIIGCAGNTILRVVPILNYGENAVETTAERAEAYRCYFRADDGETAVENAWKAGDQARCQTFNIKPGVYENASNTFYWRLVLYAGADFVDLDVEDCAENSGTPKAGDEIAQFGSRTDASRMNAILIVVNGNDAPAIIQYKGINSYSLEDRIVTKLSPSGNLLTGDLRRVTSTGNSIPAVIDVGAWYSGMQCCYMYEVAHNGSTWRCIYTGQDSAGNYLPTTQEPSFDAEHWLWVGGKGNDPVMVEFDLDGDDTIGAGETTVITARLKKGWEDISDRVIQWTVTRETPDTASDNVWNADHSAFNGTLAVTLEDLGYSHKAKFIFTARYSLFGDLTETITEELEIW